MLKRINPAGASSGQTLPSASIKCLTNVIGFHYSPLVQNISSPAPAMIKTNVFTARCVVALVLFVLFTGGTALGINRCQISVGMANNNRYAYDTAEECSPLHSVPFGNWGVSSNVGFKVNGEQFKGWDRPCNQTNPQWNSCSVDYVKPDPDCEVLNFPDNLGTYPFPANGYPWTDSYSHNNSVFTFEDKCVDQYSPCGTGWYGGTYVYVPVSRVVDSDNDWIMDSGGCMDLDGQQLVMTSNFMTVYELDSPDPDDVINTLFFPNVSVTLNCVPEGCWADTDTDLNGQPDDVNTQTSSAYVYPNMYEDNYSNVSYATDTGVPAKRIDATIRIGSVSGGYLGIYPCNQMEEDTCNNFPTSHWWDEDTCTCVWYEGSGGRSAE